MGSIASPEDRPMKRLSGANFSHKRVTQTNRSQTAPLPRTHCHPKRGSFGRFACVALLSQIRGEEPQTPRLPPVEQRRDCYSPAGRPSLQRATRPLFFEREVQHVLRLCRCCRHCPRGRGGSDLAAARCGGQFGPRARRCIHRQWQDLFPPDRCMQHR